MTNEISCLLSGSSLPKTPDMRYLFCLLFFASFVALPAQTNLRFDKMIYASDSLQTCPSGYIWEVQSVLNTPASLKESFGSSFLTGLSGGQSEADALMKNDLKMTQVFITKTWFYPSSFPFWVDEGTGIASGNKARLIVIAQYKIQQ